MSNDIRAALERLVELDKSNITMRSKPAAQAWQLAIAAATTALAQPEREGLRELQCPASVARGCHEAAAEAESGSPLQQLLVAAGDLLAQPEVEGPDHVNLIAFAYGREPWATWLKAGGCLESAHCELIDLLTAVLARWGRPTAPPAQGPAPDSPAEALAARPLLQEVARLDNSVGITVAEVRQQLAAHLGNWLRENPPGQPVAIEPRGCPTPGACSCVVPVAPPAPEVGEVGELVAGLSEIAQILRTLQWHHRWVAKLTRAAALLQQLTAPAPAVVPVAVSERLPDSRPESEGGDCDAEGRCWVLMPRSATPDPKWTLLWRGHLESYHSHWLPASAIPAPSNYIRDQKSRPLPMTNPPPLSPAAQAVKDAIGEADAFWDEEVAAAVLRAATDHGEYMVDPADGKIAVVRVSDLQSWAAELEGTNA